MKCLLADPGQLPLYSLRTVQDQAQNPQDRPPIRSTGRALLREWDEASRRHKAQHQVSAVQAVLKEAPTVAVLADHGAEADDEEAVDLKILQTMKITCHSPWRKAKGCEKAPVRIFEKKQQIV
jgi:hypothetical protein